MTERTFNPARLSARRTYKGGFYTDGTCRQIERTGKEWRELLKDMTTKIVDGTDVLALALEQDRYGRMVRTLRYEVYVGA